MGTETYINISNLINQHTDLINRIKTEKFNEKWILDIYLNSLSLHIIIDNNIKVDINESLNQYILDFYKNERIFENFEQFREFFLEIINGYEEKTKGLYVTHNGEDVLCNIEVTSIDPDRQMGPETHYEVSIADENGEPIVVADVSEYPFASFSVYIPNEEFQEHQHEIEQYFFDQSMGLE